MLRLVKIAALIAIDAPPASYVWQVANALAEGPRRRTSSACWSPSRRRSADPGSWPPRRVMVALGLTLPDGV